LRTNLSLSLEETAAQLLAVHRPRDSMKILSRAPEASYFGSATMSSFLQTVLKGNAKLATRSPSGKMNLIQNV